MNSGNINDEQTEHSTLLAYNVDHFTFGLFSGPRRYTKSPQSRKGILLMSHELNAIVETFILKQQLNEKMRISMHERVYF